jgi:hypothetical protein
MARTPIANLTSEQRNSLSFIGTITDGSAFLELAGGYALRVPYMPYGTNADTAYLIALVTYYGQDVTTCAIGGHLDPDTGEVTYYGTKTDTFVRTWYTVLDEYPYPATVFSTVTWTQTSRATPAGIHKVSEGISCTFPFDGDDADPPSGWNVEDLGTPPTGSHFHYEDVPRVTEFSNPVTDGALSGTAEAQEVAIYTPPREHYYWEVVCAYNYRQGLADFLFLGGIQNSAQSGSVRRHVAELKVVGSRIPCTLQWTDTLINLREDVPHVDTLRTLTFGPGNWSSTLDDGYPDEGFAVLRDTGRVIPHE